MFSRKLRASLVLALSILVLALAFVLFLNTLVKIPSVQSYLLTRISTAIGYELHASTMSVSLGRGIGISARGLEAKSLAGPEKILASRIRVTLDTKELLRGRIVPTRVFLYQPQIELATEKDMVTLKAGEEAALKEILAKKLPRLVAVSMEDGRISLRNTPFELTDLDFNVFKESDDPLIHQGYVRGKAWFRKEESSFTLRGTITQDIRTKNDFFAEVTLKTGKIPLRWVPWPSSINVGKGHATLSANLKGRLGWSLSALGKIDLNDLHFSFARQERGKTFSFPHLALDFASVYAKAALEISTLRIKAPDFLITASSRVDISDTSNPRLILDVESPYMPLKAFKGIFPTPILPLWFEKRLFPLLTEGEVRVNRFSMNGTLRQLKNLALPENFTSLSLKVAWKNLEVLRDEAPLPFRSVSGELDIKNGALLLSGLKAQFGKSDVKAASLEVRNLFGGWSGYGVLVEGFYDLGDLLKQADMGLIPAKLREKLDGFESASGNLKASVSAVYEKNKGFPQIRKGEFSFQDCKVIHPELFFPLLVGEGQIQVDGKGRARFQGTGLWGDSIFDAFGSVENAFKTVKAEIVAQGDMDGIVDRFVHGESPLVRFGDLVPCRVTLAKMEKTWFFQGEIDPKKLLLETAYLSMSPRGKGNKIRFSFDFQPGEGINFRKLSCVFGSSSLEVSGFYDLKGGDLSHFRVTSPGLLLEDLGIQAKNLISRTKGRLIFDTKVKLSRQNPLMTSVKGKVETRDASFMVSGLPSIFHGCFSQLTFDKKEIFIDLLKIKAGKSALHINGKLNGWDGLKGQLTINADYLNASDFIPVRGKPSKAVKGRDLPRFLRKTDVEMKLNAARGRWGSIECGSINAEGAFRSGDLHIYHSELQMDQGMLSAKGHVKRAKEPEVWFSSHIKLNGQPVKGLFEPLGLKESYLEGQLTMEAVLSGKGRRAEELIPGLTGNASFLIEKGTIKKSNVVLKVLDFLSLQKIFKQKPPDLSKEGLYFETIGGNLTVTDGIVTTENLIMKSPVLNAAAQGAVDLTKKRVDFDLGTQPLGTIDFLVSKIPIVGYILTGKGKTLLIYYFKVEGPISHPEVRYVPLKNLGGSVIGFIKRLFSTPERLLEELSEVAGSLSEKGTSLSK